MTKNRRFRWGDGIPAVCCLVLAGALLIAQLSWSGADSVRVQTPSGEYTLPLSANTEQVFVGHDGLSVTVVVQDGAVRVTQADCDDQVCVHTGKIGRHNGRSIACLPAGIVVTVTSDKVDAPDAVAR